MKNNELMYFYSKIIQSEKCSSIPKLLHYLDFAYLTKRISTDRDVADLTIADLFSLCQFGGLKHNGNIH